RTSFVGRDADLRSVQQLLDEGVHIITLLGPPGIGKTRLALELASRFVTTGGRALFCDVSAARTPEDLHAAAARALDRRIGPAAATIDQLGEALAHRPDVLLVLD